MFSQQNRQEVIRLVGPNMTSGGIGRPRLCLTFWFAAFGAGDTTQLRVLMMDSVGGSEKGRAFLWMNFCFNEDMLLNFREDFQKYWKMLKNRNMDVARRPAGKYSSRLEFWVSLTEQTLCVLEIQTCTYSKLLIIARWSWRATAQTFLVRKWNWCMKAGLPTADLLSMISPSIKEAVKVTNTLS